MSLDTMLPAPMIAPLPILVPFKTETFAPIQTSSSMITSLSLKLIFFGCPVEKIFLNCVCLSSLSKGCASLSKILQLCPIRTL